MGIIQGLRQGRAERINNMHLYDKLGVAICVCIDYACVCMCGRELIYLNLTCNSYFRGDVGRMTSNAILLNNFCMSSRVESYRAESSSAPEPAQSRAAKKRPLSRRLCVCAGVGEGVCVLVNI